MRWFRTLFVALFLLSAEVNSTPLIIRTGQVNKPFQVLAWGVFGFNRTSKSYDWGQDKFYKPQGFEPTTTVSADLLAALGLPAKLELGGVLPLAMKNRGDNSATGIGDLLVIGRYGLLQKGLLPIRGALSLAVSLPTGDKNSTPALGDGSTDFALGLAFNTANLPFVTGHLRGAYWLNGKSGSIKYGNMLEYMAGLDFAVLPGLTPQLALSGYNKGQSEVNGRKQPNSEESRMFLGLLLLWKPLPVLVIRPKVSVPVPGMNKGGTIADFYPGLDLWVTLP
ncbi:MAG: transporter [candidate division WOR-3 bacterium]